MAKEIAKMRGETEMARSTFCHINDVDF